MGGGDGGSRGLSPLVMRKKFHVDEFSRRFDGQLLIVDDLTSRGNDCGRIDWSQVDCRRFDKVSLRDKAKILNEKQSREGQCPSPGVYYQGGRALLTPLTFGELKPEPNKYIKS